MSHDRYATRIAAGLGAAALLAALAACGPADPDPGPGPEPSPEPIAGCSPEDATITWRSVHDAENVLAGVQVITFHEEREGRTTETHTLETEPDISGEGIASLTDLDTDMRAEWQRALIADARRTGQVPENYGGSLEVATEPYIDITDPEVGTYVIAVAATQKAMPFSVDCGGIRDAEGTVYAATPGTTVSVLFRCGLDYTGFDPVQLPALEYCPES